MERSYISHLNKAGKKVLLKGWVHEVKDQSNIKFLLLRDNSGIIQLVVTKDKKCFKDIAKIPKESVISINGTVQKANVKHPEASINNFEILVDDYNLLSEADKKLPMQIVHGKDAADLSVRLDLRWLDLRKPKNLLIFKIWTCMEQAMREYWEKNSFIQVYSPKFMSAPSESGAELFSVPYFGKTAYLAQSPQFYKQMAMASGFEKIFEIGPVFRANPSHTTRHDTEFTMVDMEISFIESHEDIMKLEENWLIHILKRLKEKYGKQIKNVFDIELTVPKKPFPRIPFKKAKEILEKEYKHKITDDLDSEAEKLLSLYVKKKHKHDFVFVTEYFYSARPFYHMKHEKDKKLTKSYDLLWKGLEITTGSQREHRYDILKKQAKEKKIHLEPIKEYLDFFKYGCPPHGGFGLSPTRMLMLLLGLKNVRETTFLPRDTERLKP